MWPRVPIATLIVWLMMQMGVHAGYHRYFAHRALSNLPLVRVRIGNGWLSGISRMDRSGGPPSIVSITFILIPNWIAIPRTRASGTHILDGFWQRTSVTSNGAM